MNKMYTAYVTLIFLFFFLITYPAQLVIIQFKKAHHLGHQLNFMMIRCITFCCAFNITKEYHYIPKKGKKYIFCSNHSSYFDIPSFYYLTPDYFKFVGKSSLNKIPLFGYMFKNLYIALDRKDKDSRIEVLERCRETLQSGLSIAIYPEGAIPHNTPQLITFKDGAFRLSVEENVPIIPVTLPYNYRVLPVGKSVFGSRDIKIIIHEPLNTKENPIHDYRELRDKTYAVISEELKKHKVI